VKIAFFGSGDFALPVLDELIRANFDCALVVSQPPRRRRRGGEEEPTLVEARARELGLDTFAPARINDDLQRLRDVKADLFVVAEYGQILSQALLDIPEQGSINVHGSLLPRWRGATPIEAALMAGDDCTGVSIQRVVAALDAGDVLATREIRIEEQDDAGTLRAKLSALGATLAAEVVAQFAAGAPPVACPQDQTLVTICRRLKKEDLVLDWNRNAVSLARQVRAFRPKPLARASSMKVVRALAVPGSGDPGTVVAVGAEGIDIGTGEGLLRIQQLVPPGRKPMSARDYANGAKITEGLPFGVPGADSAKRSAR
jgi:methionyl-tRNA formyltransferase